MEYVTVSDLKNLKRELDLVRREVHELRHKVEPDLPEEKISQKERRELRRIFAGMKAGKEKDWREIDRP